MRALEAKPTVEFPLIVEDKSCERETLVKIPQLVENQLPLEDISIVIKKLKFKEKLNCFRKG